MPRGNAVRGCVALRYSGIAHECDAKGKARVGSMSIIRALGVITKKGNREFRSVSPFLPVFSFYEVHDSSAIRAEPEAIIAAVAALDARADRVVDVLLSIRELPSTIRNSFRTPSQRQSFVPFGLDTFTLLQRTDNEIAFGLVGRFWRPDFGICHIPSARDFEASSDPGVAKLVLRFQAIEHPGGPCTLRTETFVYCANTRTKLLFTPYWLVIRFASGWIRHRTLASIQRQLSTGKP